VVDLRKRERSPYHRGDSLARIDDGPPASAAMCRWLANRAFQTQSAPRLDVAADASEDAAWRARPGTS